MDGRVPLITCRQSITSARIMSAKSTVVYRMFHIGYVTLANDDTNQLSEAVKEGAHRVAEIRRLCAEPFGAVEQSQGRSLSSCRGDTSTGTWFQVHALWVFDIGLWSLQSDICVVEHTRAALPTI
ncbi:hypothetical protein G5I_06430 [Acromyrmex echinatior]|uniref:Uncharacterized protein n=1 Tax=Acromyrmex echinatior TaxID=103372 RepID=F4WL08_ACREC|nr:hypothetical protein G5I_06430 [Acromyrmex echinatior]